MTVTTSLNYKEYEADGKANTFTIPFLLLARNDLNIFLDNKPITQNYTIRGIGNPISEIIFNEAPIGRLLLQRSIKLVRETDYQENGDLLAKTVNQDFDRIYLAMQGFAQDNTKAIRVIDPEGVNALPLANERANKTFSFDSKGQPMLTRVEANTAVDLAQKLADSTDPQVGVGMVGYSQGLEYPEKTIGNAVNHLADRCDYFEGNGVPAFSVFWWPSRSRIPAGYVAADGQELSQAAYPSIAKAILQGEVPTVSEIEWQSDPTKRGSYVANSSEGQFRLPDYNGKYADSLGALFLRGDNGLVSNGEIQRDALQNIKGKIPYLQYANVSGYPDYLDWSNGNALFSKGMKLDSAAWTGSIDGSYETIFDTSKVVRAANETRPLNVCGCWVIKLFTAATNATEVNVQQLITDNANLLARLSVLESWQQANKFTIIYPNGGTAENPSNVEVNKRYEEDNPFANEPVICEVETFINGNWGRSGWIYASGGQGVIASHCIEQDKIIIQTGSSYVGNDSRYIGSTHGNIGAIVAAPCRVKVWRVK